MKAPKNRRVFVIGYGAATPLGRTFSTTWERAVKAEAGFRTVTRCHVKTLSHVVGEIPDWDPLHLGLADEKEVYNWNAAFVILTMAVCREALEHAGLIMDNGVAPKTACLIGSAINGTDAFRCAVEKLRDQGPLKVSPYLLPNICANLPAGKAGMELGFTGPIFSPQGACASANYALALGARMIRDGDCDFALAGGVDMPIIPEILHGFANMNATIKIHPYDRAHGDPSQASRPFSVDRKGFVVAEGAGILVLAAEETLKAHGLQARAEIMGVGWSSDAHHFTVSLFGRVKWWASGTRSTTRIFRRGMSLISMPTGPPPWPGTARKSIASGPFSAIAWPIYRFHPTNPRSAIPWAPPRRLKTP